MGVIEMLILGVGAIVGTVTLFEEPPDIMFDEIVVPQILEERGYSSAVLAELLDDAGQLIYSKSNRSDFSLRIHQHHRGVTPEIIFFGNFLVRFGLCCRKLFLSWVIEHDHDEIFFDPGFERLF